MQAKDLFDATVLDYLAGKTYEHTGLGANRTEIEKLFPDAPEKVVLAKMRGLIKRGLVDGCGCGCRGNFEITDKGRPPGAEGGES